MKITLLKEKLEKTLERLERVSGKGTNLPILSFALLEEEDGLLKCSATNLDLGMIVRTSAKLKESSAECIPIRQVREFLQFLPVGPCNLEFRERFLFIQGGSAQGKIPTLPKDEFPIIPTVSAPLAFSVDAGVLRKGLEMVLPAVARGQARVEFTGIFFKASPEGIHLAATDSFRLAEKVFLLPVFRQPPTKELSCILPYFLVQELIQNISDNQTLECFWGEHQVLARMPEIEIVSRLIQGAFPNYRDVIPASPLLAVELERSLFMNTVSLAGLFAGRMQEVEFTFDIRGKSLTLRAQDTQRGEGSSLVPFRLISGSASPPLRFNLRYILDALRVIPSSRVTLGFSGEERPLIVRASDDTSFLFLVMPIRSGL